MVNKFLVFVENETGSRYLSSCIFNADELSHHLKHLAKLNCKVIRIVTLTIGEDSSSIYSVL